MVLTVFFTTLAALLAAPFIVVMLRAATPARVAEVLAAAGLAVDAVAPLGRSLEDVFLELTGRGLRDA